MDTQPNDHYIMEINQPQAMILLEVLGYSPLQITDWLHQVAACHAKTCDHFLRIIPNLLGHVNRYLNMPFPDVHHNNRTEVDGSCHYSSYQLGVHGKECWNQLLQFMGKSLSSRFESVIRPTTPHILLLQHASIIVTVARALFVYAEHEAQASSTWFHGNFSKKYNPDHVSARRCLVWCLLQRFMPSMSPTSTERSAYDCFRCCQQNKLPKNHRSILYLPCMHLLLCQSCEANDATERWNNERQFFELVYRCRSSTQTTSSDMSESIPKRSRACAYCGTHIGARLEFINMAALKLFLFVWVWIAEKGQDAASWDRFSSTNLFAID